MQSTLQIKQTYKARVGSVLVETAICIPVFVLILFAAIEFSRANQLRHTVDTAAYEAARNGIVPGATSNDCKATAERILKAAGARNYTITVSPSNINDASKTVRVTIELPMSSNGYVTGKFLGDKTLVASSTKSRETLSNYSAITEPAETGLEIPVVPELITTVASSGEPTSSSGSTSTTTSDTSSTTSGTSSGDSGSTSTSSTSDTSTSTGPQPIPFDY